MKPSHSAALTGLFAFAGVCGVAVAQPVFSIDFQGPPIGALDAFFGIPITEGDILLSPVGVPAFGPFALPPGIVYFGGPPAPGPDLGLPLWLGAVGHPPGFPGVIEVDALSFGNDCSTCPPAGPPLCRFYFSVDEFATGLPGPPSSVMGEGVTGTLEASANVFTNAGPGAPPPIPPVPPGFVAPDLGVIDGDGVPPFGGPGIALAEPNPPTPFALPDPGSNLDALDIDTGGPFGFPLPYPVYFSLDAGFVDPLEGPPVNSGSAIANGGFSGGDVLVTVAPAVAPVLYAPAALLGLDLAGGFDSDDLDALVLIENGIPGFQPPPAPLAWCGGAFDEIYFSVRRGSAVIGLPDSAFGAAILPGDILMPPIVGGLSPFPAIAWPAESLGLTNPPAPGRISPFPPAFPFDDDLDALDMATDCNNNMIPDNVDVASGTSTDVNGDGIPDECQCPFPNQDVDFDGDVDVANFLTFQACFNGPGNPYAAGPPVFACRCMDEDADLDVDVADYLAFQACFNGPGNPPAAGCP